mmetsp:Transcript_13293/g.43309  ORF Transcript_13293/g.43309 Transcript_13293/m.43309 type:complete len:338 (-) Transcript_13293:43-1056(-)
MSGRSSSLAARRRRARSGSSTAIADAKSTAARSTVHCLSPLTLEEDRGLVAALCVAFATAGQTTSSKTPASRVQASAANSARTSSSSFSREDNESNARRVVFASRPADRCSATTKYPRSFRYFCRDKAACATRDANSRSISGTSGTRASATRNFEAAANFSTAPRRSTFSAASPRARARAGTTSAGSSKRISLNRSLLLLLLLDVVVVVAAFFVKRCCCCCTLRAASSVFSSFSLNCNSVLAAAMPCWMANCFSASTVCRDASRSKLVSFKRSISALRPSSVDAVFARRSLSSSSMRRFRPSWLTDGASRGRNDPVSFGGGRTAGRRMLSRDKQGET